MRTTWMTVRELRELSQKTRNNLVVNFGKRIIPLNDIDLDVFSRKASLPIAEVSVFDEEEKNYLRALLNVINVTRDKGTEVLIQKLSRYNRKQRKDNLEISISFRYNHEWQEISLPQFSADKNYYRGMAVDVAYNLENQLDLSSRDICN